MILLIFIKSSAYTGRASEKINIILQDISKWENDLSYPDLPSAKILANILHVTTDKLFNG